MIQQEQIALGLAEIAQELSVLRLARKSFWEYRKLVNPKLKDGWFHRDLAQTLQNFYVELVNGKSPKLVIQAPPQHGKSLAIIDFISWMAGHDLDRRTIYASFSDRLGVRANLRLQRLYDSPLYKRVFGEMLGKGGASSISSQLLRNREMLEYSGHEGYFRNTTVCGSITGESLDLGVIDDPIKGRDQANSEAVRNKTWEWLTDDFLTRFSEGAGLLCILTRWHIDDPIGRLIASDPSVKVVTFKAIATEDEKHRKAGEALFPEHKSLEFLERIKTVMSHASFESLYQQSPIISGGNMFKPDTMPIIDKLPDELHYVRAWDMAATDGGGAYTAGVKLGIEYDGSRVYICDVVRVQGSPDEVEALIKHTARRDGYEVAIHMPQDPGQAGKAQMVYYAKQLMGYSVYSEPVTGDKELNASPMAAQVNIGNVSMLRASWNDAFVDEMRYFPNGKYKDQIDAAALGFRKIAGLASSVELEVVAGLMSAGDNW